MAKKDDVRSLNQIKAYPRGSAQGGRAIQAVKGNMAEYDGIDGHRTVVRETSEGRAIARTRDRMPMVEVEKNGEPLYMESGHLEWTFPGPGNPERYDCAKWRFDDINPAGDWLGEVDLVESGYAGQQSDPQPTPIDTGILRDNIDSLAIGYQRSTNAVTDYDNKTKAGDKTVAKKMAAGYFPSSFYSGKMRLFVQAQMGAAQGNDNWKMAFNLVGTTATLSYSHKGQPITLGLWSNNSPGIYTAPDGTYWFLHITMDVSGAYVVSAYKIITDDAAEDLFAELDLATSAVEKSKIEGYIFAHSYIDLTTKREAGRYNPGRTGSAIAYGWKWNSSGSEASVVIVGTTGTYGNLMLTSTTLKFAISYKPVAGTSPSPSWISAVGSHVAHPDWMDGWGSYNIFVPTDESGGPLELFSLAIDRAAAAGGPFSFSDVHIYGYYKDDVWTPVVISRSDKPDTTETWDQTESGVSFNADMNMNAAGRFQYGYHLADQGYTAKAEHYYGAFRMGIAFGEFSFQGVITGTVVVDETLEVSEPGGDSGPFMTFYPIQVGNGALYDGSSMPSIPSGKEAVGSTYVGVRRATYTYNNWTTYATKLRVWVFVIPSGDAESAYIVTRDYKNVSSATHYIKTIPTVTVKIVLYFKDGTLEYTPWTRCTTQGWYGDGSTITIVYDTAPKPQSDDLNVLCFNKAVHGVLGTPHTSYASLFDISQSYPFFDPGMTMFTSYNLRYSGSEGVKNPASLPLSPRFVGWA